ncbi:alcohol dehydrogenase [Corynebacterium hylobatis]|uniref:Alcohol dehydrogenase n=1 Tax=Corynebacterium hylobatis TaxID=1859290 RepID=A0A430HYN1_9CORY|nr:zinc-binding dehydrogenase [Corynebacterium hylobatis]RSZ63819.1 alcohol dehydrogenase [Corynebacterium hylobatis]
MKAAVVPSAGAGFEIVDVQIAAPEAKEVLIDVKAVGLCHSDYTLASADLGFPFPAVFGHEISGVVREVGENVTALRVGDPVVAALVRYCGECERCLSGQSYYCRNVDFTLREKGQSPRLSVDGQGLTQAFGLGGFAEQALVHENQLAKIPAGIPFENAALLGCGVITGAGAVLNTAKVGRGETVAVIGAGGVGLNAISAAVLAGASRIVALDISDEKLAKASGFGATDTINSLATDPVQAIHEIIPEGIDHVFDFVGSERVAQQGLDMLSYGGALYLVGIGGADVTVTVNAMKFMRNRNRLESVYMGSANLQVDIPFFAGLEARGLLRLDELISETIALEDINDGYRRLKEGAVSRLVVVNP